MVVDRLFDRFPGFEPGDVAVQSAVRDEVFDGDACLLP